MSYVKDGTMLFAAGLLLLGLHMLRSAAGWGVYGPEGPGPGFFPLIYGLVMALFSSVLVMQRIAAHREWQPAPETPEQDAAALPLIAWLALLASVPLMSLFGFIAGFGLMLFFMVRVVFGRSTRQSAIVAAGIVIGLYIGFSVLLGLPLPRGKLWGF